LPRELAVKNINAVGKTYYVYSADGVKLQSKHLFGSDMNYTPIFGSTSGDANLNLVKTTDYVGNRVYENGSLKRVLFDGGYIEGGVFYYYITDHFGNVRVVANSSGTVIQRNHYYPYGMAFAENTIAEQGKQPYKYNGKELDQMHGLNLYDYSARQMEPALGRFTTMDPMCEKYYDWSPYAYVSNNPIIKIDPDGMDEWEMDYDGRIRRIKESRKHTLYALDKDGVRTGQSITIKNKSIFDGLTATGMESGYAASYVHGNPSELASVFLFGADNSNVEWRFSRYDTGDGDRYAIGTIHEESLAIAPAQMGFAREFEIAFIHSHPGKYPNMIGEYSSMGWRLLSDVEADFHGVPRGKAVDLMGDSYNVHNNINSYQSNANYLTYFPHSGNVYQVRGSLHPALIRNIKNHSHNPKKLFWGTLNGR
jgi:RHS repeat-associated protein